MNLVQVLKRCEVFVGLDDSALEKIAGLSSWRTSTYRAGEFIFYENTLAKDFYILDKGEVSLVVALPKEGAKELAQIPLDTITKGDVFGWSSLVAPHCLTMSAVCVKSCSVVAVNGAELSQLFDTNCSIGYEVMKGLVRVIGARLRDLRGRLVDKEKLRSQEEVRAEQLPF